MAHCRPLWWQWQRTVWPPHSLRDSNFSHRHPCHFLISPIHSSSHSFVHWKFLALGWKWMVLGRTTQKEHAHWSTGFLKGHSTQMPQVPSMWAIGLNPGAFKTPLERLCMHFNATPCVEMSPSSRTQDLQKESVNLTLLAKVDSYQPSRSLSVHLFEISFYGMPTTGLKSLFRE
jgi:hypothetical protein